MDIRDAEQLIASEDYVAARQVLSQLLMAGERGSELYSLLGSVELNSGHFSIARQYLLEALRLSPVAASARENLQYLDDLQLQLTRDSYVAQWFDWRLRHLDYPRVIHLETVGRCNAKCDFCPHPSLERKFDAMPDELFARIVDEVRTFPPDVFSGFALHAVNEPFMDRKIFTRMEMINQTLPQAQIGIVTNMNVMPPDFFERIARIRNISDWSVSFNAANREEYEATMQISFTRTVNNIRQLIEQNRRQRIFPGPMRLTRVRTHDARDERYEDECRSLFREYVEGCDYVTVQLGRANWLGLKPQAVPRLMQFYPCHQWMNMTIHCNGIVPHCCFDAAAAFAFGDLKTQSLLDIYNSPRWRMLRETVAVRDTVHPCRDCDLC